VDGELWGYRAELTEECDAAWHESEFLRQLAQKRDDDPWIDCPCPGTKGCEKCEQVTPQD